MSVLRVWLGALLMFMLAAAIGCGAADPDGSKLNRPADYEETAQPKPAPPSKQKTSPSGTPTTDAGAPDSSAAPPSQPSDAGATPDVSTPANKLVLAGISPMTAGSGSGNTTLTVTGSGFNGTTKVLFGAVSLTPSASSATSLTVSVPATALTTAGSVEVRVANGSDTAGPTIFTVSNTVITVTKLTPNTAAAGSAAVTMKVTGTGFLSTAKVSFNGTPLTTTYTSATEVSAVVPATSLATAGTFPVTVAAGSSVSAPLMFTVESAKPIFETFSPGSVTAGSSSTTVSIYGKGFKSNTKVSVNGYVAPTAVLSTTAATVVVDAYYLTSPGTVTLRVYQDTGGATAVYADAVGYLTVEAAAQAPTYTSMTPSSAPAGTNGTWVTITGSGFGAATGVAVDGYTATVSLVSATQIKAWLTPANLSAAGNVTVSVYNALGDGTAYYAADDGTFVVY